MNTHTPTDPRVLVLGAGPAGLATAGELTARRIPVSVLERGTQPGFAWTTRYDGLRFNTSRHSSALPGAPFPREYGQFPTRDQYVDYLRDYAAERGLTVETGIDVSRISPNERGWHLSTSAGDRRSRHVVVATGALNRPQVPQWAEDPSFDGEVLHSSAYRNAGRFTDRAVVVVGAGSTGMEIAHELATGGAKKVYLAVRTPPNILFREVNGVPGDLPVPLFLHLPAGLVDRMLFALQRRTIGDLSAYGLPAPTEGSMAQLKARGAGTAIVDQETIQAIREGLIECVPAVTALAGSSVLLSDGRSLHADAVILATGYRTGLDELVHGLGVLTRRGLPVEPAGGEVAPGLRFIGYVPRPGLTGYVGKVARRVARQIAATER